jgi:TonB family protein
MKKLAFLTAITFSLLFSSTCWGEWTKVTSQPGRAIFYVDFNKINHKFDYIYFWVLEDLEKSFSGYKSTVAYLESDCSDRQLRTRALFLYRQSMGKGKPFEIQPEQFEKYSVSNDWKYPAPGTVKEIMMDKVCKYNKSSSLLKELDELDRLNKQARAALNKPEIKKQSVQIKIDTSKLSSRHSQKFKSEIRDLKMAETQRQMAAPAASRDLGDPAADVLSKYIGGVYVKIFENWKDPLGGGDGRVGVAFTVFPRGNIAMPKIVKSSGDSKLDNLAIRAVKNAVPFSPFPKEIKEPNLPFILGFDYVPKN